MGWELRFDYFSWGDWVGKIEVSVFGGGLWIKDVP